MATTCLTSVPPPAYFDDLFVGCIAAQLDDASLSGGKRAYITVLGVLAPYRDRGVGSRRIGASRSPRPHRAGQRVVAVDVRSCRYQRSRRGPLPASSATAHGLDASSIVP